MSRVDESTSSQAWAAVCTPRRGPEGTFSDGRMARPGLDCQGLACLSGCFLGAAELGRCLRRRHSHSFVASGSDGYVNASERFAPILNRWNAQVLLSAFKVLSKCFCVSGSRFCFCRRGQMPRRSPMRFSAEGHPPPSSLCVHLSP